ncbi:hypothetical protein FBU59_001912 [Linderina macrospora]|uniref:Uncharacterized protein n=1 Tax=Linderina macrospora TaxID=4868 RepID=A0ACC1JCH1_9FUNG|nr:hypothetical protein FBU59_001912 [Linderina macrospora]
MDEKQRLADLEQKQSEYLNHYAQGVPPGSQEQAPATPPRQQAPAGDGRGDAYQTTRDVYPPYTQAGPVSSYGAAAHYSSQAYNNQAGPVGQDPPRYSDVGPIPPEQYSNDPYGAQAGPSGYHGAPPPFQNKDNMPQDRAIPGQQMKLDPGTYIEIEGAPAKLDCPYCHLPIITQIKTKTGTKTVVAAVAIAVVFWPLAFIPFVSKRMKKSVHICPHCRKDLGKIVTVSAVRPVQH